MRFSLSADGGFGGRAVGRFGAALDDPRTHLWVAEEKGVPVGQVRVDVEGDEAGGAFLDRNRERSSQARCWPGNAAPRGSRRSDGRRDVTTLTALTHPDNEASIHAFEKVGFTRVGARDGFVVLELALG